MSWNLELKFDCLNFQYVHNIFCSINMTHKTKKSVWIHRKQNGWNITYLVDIFSNKNVPFVWRDLSYILTGETITNDHKFQESVTGITISPKKSFLMSLFLMSQKVAHNNEQGIKESSKKIIQMIAFNWQHSILKLFDNFFKLNSDSFKFCAWVLNSAKNEFDRGSRIDHQNK